METKKGIVEKRERERFLERGEEINPSPTKQNFLKNKMETKERIVEEKEVRRFSKEEKEEKKERERFLEKGEEINPSPSKI